MLQAAVTSFTSTSTSGLIFWCGLCKAQYDLRANTLITLWSQFLLKKLSHFASKVADILYMKEHYGSSLSLNSTEIAPILDQTIQATLSQPI
jgi:hypothetical protein